jgi:glycosyltransferase involved in cell wall biosynthesis
LDPGEKTLISVILLTFNDEDQIGRCIKSVQPMSDDIIVVDSFSTDTTVNICKDLGCRVYQNPFVNQAVQFNWALNNIDTKHPWIIRLDSDEMVPKALREEILARTATGEPYVAYALNRRMYWMGRWLRHGRMYPHYIVRLFKKDSARYEERTEEHLIVNGPIGRMRCDFLEDNTKNNLDYFTEKHMSTARGELQEWQQFVSQTGLQGNAIKGNLFGNKVERTRWLKEKVYARTPLFVRPFLYFFHRYFLCLGFLDGKSGLIFHVLQAFWYRFYIDAKIFEATQLAKTPTPENFDSIS